MLTELSVATSIEEIWLSQPVYSPYRRHDTPSRVSVDSLILPH